VWRGWRKFGQPETLEHSSTTWHRKPKPTDQEPLREPENLYKLGSYLSGNEVDKLRMKWQCIPLSTGVFVPGVNVVTC
jgi:hypothetical protein